MEGFVQPRSMPAMNNLTKEWVDDLSFQVYW
jgi:hypothetical protein